MKANQFLFNARHARTSEAPIETMAEDTSEGQQVTPTKVHLPFEAELPSLGGATAWLNSPPLSAADLRGKVVLIDFWTYTCINWLRTLPYVRAWAEKYQEHGVVVIGVHTPQGSAHRNGHGTCRVHRRATRAAGEADEPGRDGAVGTELGTLSLDLAPWLWAGQLCQRNDLSRVRPAV